MKWSLIILMAVPICLLAQEQETIADAVMSFAPKFAVVLPYNQSAAFDSVSGRQITNAIGSAVLPGSSASGGPLTRIAGESMYPNPPPAYVIPVSEASFANRGYDPNNCTWFAVFKLRGFKAYDFIFCTSGSAVGGATWGIRNGDAFGKIHHQYQFVPCGVTTGKWSFISASVAGGNKTVHANGIPVFYGTQDFAMRIGTALNLLNIIPYDLNRTLYGSVGVVAIFSPSLTNVQQMDLYQKIRGYYRDDN